MSLPLEGIRVLDLSQVFAMPGAGMYLADQGADVIKIEPPTGDLGRVVLTTAPVNNESRAFWVLNRNKRSVVLDLKQPEGRAVLHRLVRESDVILHTARAGTDRKLGLDYETISAVNPRIIYVGFTAWGKRGPFAAHRGYDLLVQGLSGMSGRRSLPGGKPRVTGIWGIDLAASIMVSFAICLALRQRDRTGQGQQVESSLLQSALALQMVDLVEVENNEEPENYQDAISQATYGTYACADGQYIQVAVANEAEWANLCRTLELSPLLDDSRFSSNEGRMVHSDILTETFTEAFRARTASEWAGLFLENDVAGVNVLLPEEVFDHDQVVANAMFIDMEQPGIGKARMINVPFTLSGASEYRFKPSPSLGQHTDEVLREFGLTGNEIEKLRNGNIIK